MQRCPDEKRKRVDGKRTKELIRKISSNISGLQLLTPSSISLCRRFLKDCQADYSHPPRNSNHSLSVLCRCGDNSPIRLCMYRAIQDITAVDYNSPRPITRGMFYKIFIIQPHKLAYPLFLEHAKPCFQNKPGLQPLNNLFL